MDNTVSKLDFPNPLNHIDIGDKPIKLEKLLSHIKTGEITAIISEDVKDFNVLAKRLSHHIECLILNRWLWGTFALKKYAKKAKKPILVLFRKKKIKHFQKGKRGFKHINTIFFLNHKPYYYMVGCKNKDKNFNIGWTVIGIKIIKS